MLWYTTGTTDLAELNNVRNFARWKARGTGPLASNIGEAGAFFASRDGLPAPDLQIHVAPSGFYDNGLHEPTSRMVTAAPTLVSVASRGHLRLRSADPGWHPAHRGGVLRGPGRPRRDAGRHATDLGDRHPGRARRPRRPSPGTCPTDPTDEDLVEHARTWAQTLYHPTSTCAMGTGEDAVVDPELRVRGVEGLRVVDAR